MLSRDALDAHNAALRAAGLIGPVNAQPAATQMRPELLEGEWNAGPTLPSSAGFTGSSDPRLAAAARRREEELMNLPQAADPKALEFPDEIAPLTEQSIEQRRANAGTMATGLPDDYVYGVE